MTPETLNNLRQMVFVEATHWGLADKNYIHSHLPELLDAVEMVNVWHFSYDKLWGQFLQLDKLYMGAWQEGANTCLANDALSRQLQVLADENAQLQGEMQAVEALKIWSEKKQADLTAKDIEIAELETELTEGDYWMKRAKSAEENGSCPSCHGGDEEGHRDGCYWGRLERENEQLKSTTLSGIELAEIAVTLQNYKQLQLDLAVKDKDFEQAFTDLNMEHDRERGRWMGLLADKDKEITGYTNRNRYEQEKIIKG